MGRPRENIQERFWRYTKKTRRCWLWTGGKFRRGYGQFSISGKNLKAHRVSYEIHIGPIPSGLLVCHKCDNPSCVNPKHLFLGTWKDNVADMTRKGRRIDNSGENHNLAKVNWKQVREIRRKYAMNESKDRYVEKKYSASKLALEYGISQTMVSNIVSGRAWK